MCNISSLCFVVCGELDSIEPDYIYRDAYNVVSDAVVKKILKVMEIVARNKVRSLLPKELTIFCLSFLNPPLLILIFQNYVNIIPT